MGVTYKLLPQIKEYILELRKDKPNLGCRKVADLVWEKFQVKISKSTVNSFLEYAGLTMPVGRRRNKRKAGQDLMLQPEKKIIAQAPAAEEVVTRPKEEMPVKPELKAPAQGAFSGNILLSAAEYLAGGDASQIFPEVRFLKLSLGEKGDFYLDGQWHTVWSKPNIPYAFSTPLWNMKGCILRYFQQNAPLVLFMAPGYDLPTKEFWDFLLGLSSEEKMTLKLTLIGPKSEEREMSNLEKAQKQVLVFGVWPWQFEEHRKIEIKGEYKPFVFEPLKEEFGLANLEMELSQPTVNKSATLEGCALKRKDEEKARLFILSNLAFPGNNPEELASLYLSRWPNLEEGFIDFGRKIETFTSSPGSGRFLSSESLALDKPESQDKQEPLDRYASLLDLYVRWHFFPAGYENVDFPTMKERFYGLPCLNKKEKNALLVTFQVPAGFAFLKDLQYALRRLNEREVILANEGRLWCGITQNR